jgi:hypothetical protein
MRVWMRSPRGRIMKQQRSHVRTQGLSVKREAREVGPSFSRQASFPYSGGITARRRGGKEEGGANIADSQRNNYPRGSAREACGLRTGATRNPGTLRPVPD